MEPLVPKGKGTSGGSGDGPPPSPLLKELLESTRLPPAWLRILVVLATKGYDYWSQICAQGPEKVREAIYDLYNAKPPCEDSAGYENAIDEVCPAGGKGLIKLRQGIFVVLFNMGGMNKSTSFDCEWRVYVNAPLASAPTLFGEVIKLCRDPRCRITQTKICSLPEEAKKRSDIIVVYTGSEEGARWVARLLGEGPCRLLLGGETVHMGLATHRGIAIGESPIAKGGDLEQAVSFGDLRAAALTLAMTSVWMERGDGPLEPMVFIKSLGFWLGKILPLIGLSTQESHRNGLVTHQPGSKSELLAFMFNWIQRLERMKRLL